jgi:integrase
VIPGPAAPAAGGGADLIAGYIAAWQPAAVPPQATAFARAAAAAAGPGTRARANALLWVAARLAAWGIPLGLETVPEVLLHPSVLERFAVSAPGLSGSARRTLRTNLRFIARRAVPALAPADAPLPRERAKAPYSPAEIAGYLALAGAQPALSRRMRASGLVCLGAGAGLIRADLRAVRGSDVACRSGGVIVAVRGARPRAVPVLARYHDRLLAAAEFAGTGLICGGTDPGRRNITTPLTRPAGRRGRAAPAGHLPAARHLAGRRRGPARPATAFMHAAGITCSQRLGDLLAGLEPAAEADAVRLPGAARPS